MIPPKSPDKKLQANKTLIYNLFREVLEARHIDQVDKYLTSDFIQHNPNAADGSAALKKYFEKSTPQPVSPKLKRPITAIIAEGDLVMVVYPVTRNDPASADVAMPLMRSISNTDIRIDPPMRSNKGSDWHNGYFIGVLGKAA